MKNAQAPPLIIVALGASNTEGYAVAPDEAFPAVLERLLRQAGCDVHVINAGASGQPTAGMLARLDDAVPPNTAVVIFQPGSNDIRLGLGETAREQNIATITQQLAQRGIPVVRVARCFECVRQENTDHLQADGIHFTPKGYARVAECLLVPVMTSLAAVRRSL